MKSNIKRFYILPAVWGTVTKSQVFNWVELVNKNSDIHTDCISLTHKKVDGNQVKSIEDLIKANFFQYKTNIPVLGHLYIFYIFLNFYFKNVKNYDKIIFQTRITMTGWAFTILRFLPKVKLIFEARGAAVEERKYVSLGKKVNLKQKLRTIRLKIYERLVITKSNKVICVSNTLKMHYVDKYQLENKTNKLVVFPGAADSTLFFHDEDLRNITRKELGYKDSDKVIIYSGKLSLKWEIPEVVFSFLKALNNQDKDFKFLILSPDQDLCNQLAKKYELIDSIKITKVSFEEVNAYLNAADIGLLLREDTPMNNVASPTKFAEYILSGLPCIISNGVYDYVELINNTNFGVILQDMNKLANNELLKINELVKINRKNISSFGEKDLSKAQYIKTYIELLEKI